MCIHTHTHITVISTHKLYCLPPPPHSLAHSTENRQVVNKQLCGAQSPARLIDNSQIGAQHGAQKVEMTADLTGAC